VALRAWVGGKPRKSRTSTFVGGRGDWADGEGVSSSAKEVIGVPSVCASVCSAPVGDAEGGFSLFNCVEVLSVWFSLWSSIVTCVSRTGLGCCFIECGGS
jgi:hypothetical protein